MPAKRGKTCSREASAAPDSASPPSWPVDTWSNYLAELVVNACTTTHQVKVKSNNPLEGEDSHARILSSLSLETKESGKDGEEPAPRKMADHMKGSLQCVGTLLNDRNEAQECHAPPHTDSSDALISQSPPPSPKEKSELQRSTPQAAEEKSAHRMTPKVSAEGEKVGNSGSQQQQQPKPQRSIRSVSIVEKMDMLKSVIEAQNDGLKAVSESIRSQRRREEQLRYRAMAQYFSKKRANNDATSLAIVNNLPSASVLHALLSTSRQLWKSLLVERLAKYVTLKPEATLSRKSAGSLPLYTELFDVLVEGLNAPKTLSWIEEYLLGRESQTHSDPSGHIPSVTRGSGRKQQEPPSTRESAIRSNGIDAFGFYSVFKTPIRCLAQFDHLFPSVHILQKYFRDVAAYPSLLFPPSSPFCSTKQTSFSRPQIRSGEGWMGSSEKTHTLETFEEQLDLLLRWGIRMEMLAKVLLQGAHPSLRRLYYARALGIPLVVSYGSTRFTESSKLHTNQFPLTGYLPAYLSFGTKRTRDRIRHCQRFRSSSSSSSLSCAHQCRATVLAPVAVNDAHVFIGDSEKYFVYEEDIAMLATTLVVDSSSIESRLHHTLQQLGRPWDSLDSYLFFQNSYSAKSRNHKTEKSRSDVGENREASPEGTSESVAADEGHGPSSFLPGFKPETTPTSNKLAITALGLSWNLAESVLHAMAPSSTALLIAPICNITGDTVEQYELLTAMMSQIWKRLLGPTPELLQCCLIFEKLTEELALPAVTKAVRMLQHPPLLLGLQWMITGFAEVLAPTEVLVFWDLLLSYHMREMYQRSPLSSPLCRSPAVLPPTHPVKDLSPPPGGSRQKFTEEGAHRDTAPELSSTPLVPCALWLLPIMAAAIFVYRAPLVERAETREQLLQVFSVTHHLSARLLIQQLLFSG